MELSLFGKKDIHIFGINLKSLCNQTLNVLTGEISITRYGMTAFQISNTAAKYLGKEKSSLFLTFFFFKFPIRRKPEKPLLASVRIQSDDCEHYTKSSCLVFHLVNITLHSVGDGIISIRRGTAFLKLSMDPCRSRGRKIKGHPKFIPYSVFIFYPAKYIQAPCWATPFFLVCYFQKKRLHMTVLESYQPAHRW